MLHHASKNTDIWKKNLRMQLEYRNSLIKNSSRKLRNISTVISVYTSSNIFYCNGQRLESLLFIHMLIFAVKSQF